MNVLITGVSGFVGQNLVTYFNSREDVKLFGHGRDINSLKQKFIGQKITLLADYKNGQLDEFDVDCIIHTAGIAHDLSNQYKSSDYFQVNTQGTKDAFTSFKNSKATQFIYMSSVKAVIDSYNGILTEDVPPSPRTPYGESKLQAEKFISAEPLPPAKQYFILRPCMIHGPGNKGNLNLLYKFVKTGLPFPLGSFENQRSFLSIDNLCFVIDYILKGTVPSGTYNLADNGFISTPNLYSLIATTSGKSSRVLKFPPVIIRTMAAVVGKGQMLAKLTENMMVSNEKILQHVPRTLAVSLQGGLTKTIQSFQNE